MTPRKSAPALRACRRCLAYEGMHHYMNRRAIPTRFLWAFNVGADGVCNVCRAYDAVVDEARLAQELVQLTVAARSGGGAVVAFSGGKDSLSALFIAKERLGLDVVAFLYDNGFIPSFVVEQAERVCRRVGVQLIVGAPTKREHKRFLSIVGQASVDEDPPCNTCSDNILVEVMRVCDDVGAGAVITGSNYFVAWEESVHAVAARTTPKGKPVLFGNVHYAARLTHKDVLKNVKALKAEVLSLPGVSSNCRVPALVQKRLGRHIGHVAEMEDLSLEVMVGHRTRRSAIAELLKKAPEQAALLHALRP